jgi:glycine dehydrogenase
MSLDSFASRHIGPRADDISQMLDVIGFNSMDELVDKTIPENIRLEGPLNLPSGMAEHEYLAMMKEKGSKNARFNSFIGMGYYPTIVPSPILRNVLENPGWYTAYTPYQAEISQGRLEALLNFQTMVSELTAMEIANASLLDEGTALAEAMIMFYNVRSRAKAKAGANKFFVDEDIFPQSMDLLISRAEPLGIELVIGTFTSHSFTEDYFGAALQYPSGSGELKDYSDFVSQSHEAGSLVAVATDLMALALATPPGEWGADAVVGNTQRFGVPMGYGGPHAAFFATKESFKRNIPGRIIGVSKDRLGKNGYRMALQTREQHIRR